MVDSNKGDRSHQEKNATILELVKRNRALELEQRDIKKAQEALKESEERFRTLVEHSPVAIVVLDFDSGRFVDANEKAIQLYGLEREKLLQAGPIEMSPPKQPNGQPSSKMAMEKLNIALQGKTPIFEWTHQNGSGKEFECEIRLFL